MGEYNQQSWLLANAFAQKVKDAFNSSDHQTLAELNAGFERSLLRDAFVADRDEVCRVDGAISADVRRLEVCVSHTLACVTEIVYHCNHCSVKGIVPEDVQLVNKLCSVLLNNIHLCRCLYVDIPHPTSPDLPPLRR